MHFVDQSFVLLAVDEPKEKGKKGRKGKKGKRGECMLWSVRWCTGVLTPSHSMVGSLCVFLFYILTSSA